jgi:hypothetical protein
MEEWRYCSTILTLGTGGEVSASSPCRFTLGKTAPGTLFYRRPSGPQSQSECYGEEKSLMSLTRIDPRLLDLSVRSLIAIPTELSRLTIASLTYRSSAFRPRNVIICSVWAPKRHNLFPWLTDLSKCDAMCLIYIRNKMVVGYYILLLLSLHIYK